MSLEKYFKTTGRSVSSTLEKKKRKRKLSDCARTDQTEDEKSEESPSMSSSAELSAGGSKSPKSSSGAPAPKRQKTSKLKADSSSLSSAEICSTDSSADAVSHDEKSEEPLTYANCERTLHQSWLPHLGPQFEKPYFKELKKKLAAEEKRKAEIFPPVNQVFRAFELCHWEELRVVILGQDPYHGDGQAEGLCFSVPRTMRLPSSLRNIYKEAATELDGFVAPKHGHLIDWAQRGVLLLNTVLTVRAHNANSHKKYGWQQFTDAVIKTVSKQHSGVVFILWGKQAQLKEKLIDTEKHRIVSSAHPSGLSAHRGFYGSKPFSKTNKLLVELGENPIDWTLTQ